jgi:endogenous inhibitor of DNA gyrase (YacG/DUF329 family)
MSRFLSPTSRLDPVSSAASLNCPICGKALAAEAGPESPLFPFCSTRCKQVDLLRWFQGKYEVIETLNPLEILEAADDDPKFPSN